MTRCLSDFPDMENEMALGRAILVFQRATIIHVSNSTLPPNCSVDNLILRGRLIKLRRIYQSPSLRVVAAHSVDGHSVAKLGQNGSANVKSKGTPRSILSSPGRGTIHSKWERRICICHPRVVKRDGLPQSLYVCTGACASNAGYS